MNVYLENCEKYFDNELQVVPINGKIPFSKDWINVDFDGLKSKDGFSFQNKNIGLKTGKKSGVICVDIDITDKKIQEKIYNQLPPILCGKKGNKDKGINYFFKYNGEESRAFKGIDILSDGKQTVIPPSIHPNGYPYVWVGVPLVHADLPDLPAGFIDWCAREFSNERSVTTGRNNRLFEICCSMIDRGEDSTTIINELIDYDKENHSPPWFEDKDERHRGKDPYGNALEFFYKTRKNLSKKVVLPAPTPAIEICQIIDTEKPKRQKFPHLRGIAGDMFSYVYENSPVPRSRLSLASVLSTMSIIIGNKVRWGSVYPNLYCLMVAPSGGGKDFPLNFPRDLLYKSDLKHLIGESHPASDSGLIMNLPEQTTRIDMIDEADILFSAINSKNSAFLSKMADVYATLYTSPGKHYGGKHILGQKKGNNDKGNLGECFSPYVAMLGAMTPKAFRNSFSTSTMEKGLGARFLYFIDEKRKRTNLKITPEAIPSEFLEFSNMWRNYEMFSYDLSDHQAADMESTDIAKKAMNDFNEYVEELKFKTSMDDKMMPLLNRMAIFAVKLAQIDAVSINPKSTSFKIGKDSVDFASRFTEALFKDNKAYLELNIAENQVEYNSNTILRIIKKHPGGISKSELYSKTRSIDRNTRRNIIQDLVDANAIKQVKIKTASKPITKLIVC